MKTGETATERGLYVSECCDEEMIFVEGDTFCRCPRCEALCEWDMQGEVLPWTDLEEEEETRAA